MAFKDKVNDDNFHFGVKHPFKNDKYHIDMFHHWGIWWNVSTSSVKNIQQASSQLKLQNSRMTASAPCESKEKNPSQRHSNASIPRRSSGCPPRYRYSFTGALLIASCQVVLLSIVWAAPRQTCTRCDGLNESQRLYCPACRITTPGRARLRPKKSLRIPAIQTTASSHCCSQKSLAKPWGQYWEVLEELLHPSYPDT